MGNFLPKEEYSMAAVIGLDSKKIDEICNEIKAQGKFIVSANYNCNVQTAISGTSEAIARNMLEMSNLKVPIICIVIGEGSSGGALAIAVGDRVVMLENAVYSILSPEGFASILYKDASKAKEAAENMKITAEDLKKLKIIDKIIEEPEGGAQNDFLSASASLKDYLISSIKELKELSEQELVQKRYEKFRKM